jgi:WD40 repeat protein
MLTMDRPAARSADADDADLTFRRHRGPVASVAAIPGRAAAVTAAYDGAVALFCLDTGAVDLLGYHRHLANHVAVNRSGSKAASSSSDYDVYIWDLRGRRLESVLRGHSDDVECFAFADERTGVSASRDQRLLVWDLATGAIRRVIGEHEKDVLSVTCHDGLIYSSGDDMTLRQWDLASGRLIRKWGPFEHETDTCAIDPRNHRVVLGCDDGVIRIFDSRDGAVVAEIPAHSSGIKKVAVSPATGDILSAAYDQRIQVFDAASLARKAELEPLASKWERSFCWTPDGAAILAGTFDGTVVVWHAASGRRVKEVGDTHARAGNACFNEASGAADGTVALVADDGLVRLIELTPASARLEACVAPRAGRVLMNAVAQDARRGVVVAGAHDHTLHVFARTGRGLEHEAALALGEGPINTIRIAQGGTHDGKIFAGCYSGAIVRASLDGRVERVGRLHDGAVKALRLHPHAPVGASCSADGGLMSWTLDGEPRSHFPGHTSIVDDVDFDPEGRQLASVSRDFTLKVYRFDDARQTHSIGLGRRSPKSVIFWDAGTVIVGDYWGALIRADLHTGKVTRRTIAANGLSSLSRTADGLVATSYDGGVYLVAAEDLTVRNVFRAMTQRKMEAAAA